MRGKRVCEMGRRVRGEGRLEGKEDKRRREMKGKMRMRRE